MPEDLATPIARCGVCAQSNPPDAKFCNQCGAQLHLVPCVHCGAINDLKATMCYQCKAVLSGMASGDVGLEGQLRLVSTSDTSAKNKHPRAESVVERLARFSSIEAGNPPSLRESDIEPLSPLSGSSRPASGELSFTTSEVQHPRSSSASGMPLKSKQSLPETNVERLPLVTFATSVAVNHVVSRRWLYVVLAVLALASLGVLAYYAYLQRVSQPALTVPQADGRDANKAAQLITPYKPLSTHISSPPSPTNEARPGSGRCTEALAALDLCKSDASQRTQLQPAAPHFATRLSGEAKEPAAPCADGVAALGLCITSPLKKE